jgi:uncharacterized membrane protein
MEAPWHFYFLACLFILAGILHFLFPRVYRRILPPWIPSKTMVVYVSGVLEILFGTCLFFPSFRIAGLYGIMILLVLFLPVHTNMLRDSNAAMGIPSWILLLRIPLQGLLIYWVYTYL